MHIFIRFLALAAVVCTIGLIPAAAGAACGSGKVNSEDQLEWLDPSWRVCIDATIARTSKEKQTWVSLMFWADRTYESNPLTFGTCSLTQCSKNKHLNPIEHCHSVARKEGR